MNQHFLQSDAWEKFQHALGNTTVRREGDGWSYLAIVEHGGGLTRLYCPYGPTVTSPAALKGALESLTQEAKAQGAAFLRVQPQGYLLGTEESAALHMKPIAYSQPVATRVVDLSPSLNDILAAVSQSKRSIIRNYQKKGLMYRMSKNPNDIEKLLPLIHDIAERNRISVHSDDYIRKQAKALLPDDASLHFIELDGQPITGAFLFEDETCCYYGHAGTAAKHYKLQANTALVGELLAYAKNKGKLRFDFYGIAPTDDQTHPWAGVTSFKAGFGGDVVRYNQTYDIPLQVLAYTAYSLLRSLKRRRG
jgi:lipid II:glycine glycyltransferase (peptidoglycan interpeptide bridge formation enzyme)